MDDGRSKPSMPPLEKWLDQPDKSAEHFAPWESAPFAGAAADQNVYALPREDRLVAATLDPQCKVLAATENFFVGDNPYLLDFALARRSIALGVVVSTTRDISRGTSNPVATYGPVDQARSWILPQSVKRSLDRKGAACVFLALLPAAKSDALRDACGSLRLTELQSQLSVLLVRTGNLRIAARRSGIAYGTARKVIGEAMKRAGASRMPAFIEQLVRLSFGVWPTGSHGDAVLKDIFGLSGREAALAVRLAQGLSRSEAAQAAGLSDAVAKKLIDKVFATLNVRSAAQLSACVNEARAAAILTGTSGGAVLPHVETAEPLRLLRRADGGTVALSDYGPRTGKPVLVLHPSTSARHVPLSLVRSLQSAGFRPIAVDRPGYGLSSPFSDRSSWRAAPFRYACADVKLVCDELKLTKIDVVGRGGAQVAIELQRVMPERLGRVVLVNPDPPTRTDGYQKGLLGAIKGLYARSPALIEMLGSAFSGFLSDETAPQIMGRAIASSPPDLELMSVPQNLADFIRGYRHFASGRIEGYVAEQLAMVDWKTDPLTGLSDWRILVSETDPLHRPEEVRLMCRSVFPDAPLTEVPGTGRFLIMSRPDRVVTALLEHPRNV